MKTEELPPQVTAIKMQFDLQLARAAHTRMRIQSGVYKKRIVRHGSFDGPLYTEQELLEEEVQTHQRHLHIAQDLLDAFMSESEKAKNEKR